VKKVRMFWCWLVVKNIKKMKKKSTWTVLLCNVTWQTNPMLLPSTLVTIVITSVPWRSTFFGWIPKKMLLPSITHCIIDPTYAELIAQVNEAFAWVTFLFTILWISVQYVIHNGKASPLTFQSFFFSFY